MTQREFITMVTRHEEGGPKTPVGSGVREMYGVLSHLASTGRQPQFASPNRLIFRCVEASEAAGGSCEITTLSPSDKQIELFWNDIADQMPQTRQTIRRAVAKSPNHLAIALWVRAGHQAVLLGSDLQETSDVQQGWSVIVRSAERPTGTAAVFKIPHHGSENGHNDAVWDQMVAEGAYALLTPFTNGNVSLPTDEDVRRICARTAAAYITANPLRRASMVRSPEVARGIRLSCKNLKLAQPALGHIRIRKRFGPEGRWYVTLMGGAYRLGTPIKRPT